MARGVLARSRGGGVLLSLLMMVLAAAARATDANPGECSSAPPVSIGPAGQLAYPGLLQHVRNSPFYAELVRIHGAPLTCTARAAESGLSVTYSFAGHARVTVNSNPVIELNDERLEVSSISNARAIELLMAEERAAYGSTGCGIAWRTPRENLHMVGGDARGIVFHGDTCNCHARILRAKDSRVTLILRSAC